MVAKFQIDLFITCFCLQVACCPFLPVTLRLTKCSFTFQQQSFTMKPNCLELSSQLVSDRLACSAALPSIEGLLSSSQAAASKQRSPCEMESQWLLEMLPNANHFHWILNVNISLWFHQSEAMLTTVMWTLEHLQSMWHVNIWALQQQKDHANSRCKTNSKHMHSHKTKPHCAYLLYILLQRLGSVQGGSGAQTLSVSQKDQEIENQSSWAMNHSASLRQSTTLKSWQPQNQIRW